MERDVILFLILALAIVTGLWLKGQKTRVEGVEKAERKVEKVFMPTWEQAQRKRSLATPLMDPASYEPPKDAQKYACMPHAEPKGIMVRVTGLGVGADMLPMCCRRLNGLLAAYLEVAVKSGETAPRGSLTDEASKAEAGKALFELGEVGGTDFYSRAGEGLYLLLQGEGGKTATFGPMLLGDVQVLAQRFADAFAALPPDAVEKSLAPMVEWQGKPREIYEDGPHGPRRVA